MWTAGPSWRLLEQSCIVQIWEWALPLKMVLTCTDHCWFLPAPFILPNFFWVFSTYVHEYGAHTVKSYVAIPWFHLLSTLCHLSLPCSSGDFLCHVRNGLQSQNSHQQMLFPEQMISHLNLFQQLLTKKSKMLPDIQLHTGQPFYWMVTQATYLWLHRHREALSQEMRLPQCLPIARPHFSSFMKMRNFRLDRHS